MWYLKPLTTGVGATSSEGTRPLRTSPLEISTPTFIYYTTYHVAIQSASLFIRANSSSKFYLGNGYVDLFTFLDLLTWFISQCSLIYLFMINFACLINSPSLKLSYNRGIVLTCNTCDVDVRVYLFFFHDRHISSSLTNTRLRSSDLWISGAARKLGRIGYDGAILERWRVSGPEQRYTISNRTCNVHVRTPAAANREPLDLRRAPAPAEQAAAIVVSIRRLSVIGLASELGRQGVAHSTASSDKTNNVCSVEPPGILLRLPLTRTELHCCGDTQHDSQ